MTRLLKRYIMNPSEREREEKTSRHINKEENYMKKMLALLLSVVMMFGLVTVTGCGNSDDNKNSDNNDGKVKLTIWTLADDLKAFAEKYMEQNDNVEIETVVIAPADYVDKTQTAILGGEDSIDIICGEPQMLGNMFDAELFTDLGALGGEEFADQLVDYVYEVGKDSDGTLRALSYQITPAGFFYRRDIAEKVFGTSDPDEIGKLFSSYDVILDTAKKLKDAGYRIFSSDSELSYMSGDTAWVIDGALNVDQSRVDYMNLCIDLYQGDYTTYASSWSTPWYQAMAGPVAILSKDSDVNVWDETEFNDATSDYEKTEVFAFGLPSWGTLTMRDHYGDTAGKWGVCAGPSYGFSGGTFVGISELSKNKEEAYKFIQWMLSDETLDWWIEKSEGDVVSKKSVIEAHKDDENPMYGNQKTYEFWLERAEGIDYSKVTQYDTKIGDAWGAAIGKIKTGEATREEAYKYFYDEVQSAYPELKIERTLLGE